MNTEARAVSKADVAPRALTTASCVNEDLSYESDKLWKKSG